MMDLHYAHQLHGFVSMPGVLAEAEATLVSAVPAMRASLAVDQHR